jgi:Uma2 family endonuclease
MVSIKSNLRQTSSASKMVTLDAYFQAETKSPTKNEYHNGIIIPMAGAKLKHNRLAGRTLQQLENFVEANDLPFIVSNSDTKIRIEAVNKVVYPDSVVLCDVPQYFNNRQDTILNPLIVVEVLSDGTDSHDRTTKFELYRTIPSFQEYVLVYQDKMQVVVWTKQPNGTWILQDYMGSAAMATIHSLPGFQFSLERLYRKL